MILWLVLDDRAVDDEGRAWRVYICALLFAPAHIPVTLSRLFCTSLLARSGAKQTGNLRSSAVMIACLLFLAYSSTVAACFAFMLDTHHVLCWVSYPHSLRIGHGKLVKPVSPSEPILENLAACPLSPE